MNKVAFRGAAATIEKHRMGDNISDAELENALKVLPLVNEFLRYAGAQYSLTYVNLVGLEDRFEGYYKSRKGKLWKS